MTRPLPTVSFEGRWVALQPLARSHVPDLVRAATADRTSYDLTSVPVGVHEMTAYVDELLAAHRAGEVLPFAQIDTRTGTAVGCTRYLELRWPAGRPDPDELEIGGTWLGARAQRSGVNTEAKYLLLRHAFDTLGVWRVAICTDEDNARSRRAIERIGATLEGILRNHRLRANTTHPRPRNTAVYSIVCEEWPDVRAGLEARMDR